MNITKSKLRAKQSITVLTGAGISAESGVPTFRGSDGLWKNFRPEQLATLEAFQANPHLVWEWYDWRRKLIKPIKPNPAHYALVELEAQTEQFTLITQTSMDCKIKLVVKTSWKFMATSGKCNAQSVSI